MSNAKIVMGQAAGTPEESLNIEDVFSTYLYSGTGTTTSYGVLSNTAQEKTGPHFLFQVLMANNLGTRQTSNTNSFNPDTLIYSGAGGSSTSNGSSYLFRAGYMEQSSVGNYIATDYAGSSLSGDHFGSSLTCTFGTASGIGKVLDRTNFNFSTADNVAAGDLILFISLAWTSASRATLPTGFTEVYFSSLTNTYGFAYRIAAKIADGSENNVDFGDTCLLTSSNYEFGIVLRKDSGSWDISEMISSAQNSSYFLGAPQRIANGVNLKDYGGAIFYKNRTSSVSHGVVDSERDSFTKRLSSNVTLAQDTGGYFAAKDDAFITFESNSYNNRSGDDYVSWTFRKAPRFFDVVTYTGTGATQSISHSLGVEPGAIYVKRMDANADWAVFHTARKGLDEGSLNQTFDFTWNAGTWFNHSGITDTTFEVTGQTESGASGGSYVAYLFAHDPLGPSGDGSDGLIACGSYTGNGSTDGPEIDLGWEPQWIMIKRTDVGGAGYDWFMFDAMRGMPVGGADRYLDANSLDAETGSSERFQINPTGFKLATTSGSFNASGGNYIYIAIRRGPMRQPEDSTEVFRAFTYTGTGENDKVYTTARNADMMWFFNKTSTSFNPHLVDRMRGFGARLQTSNTSAEFLETDKIKDVWNTSFNAGSTGSNFNGSGIDYVDYIFRRAPGFFDVVAYTGDGTFDGSYNVNHSLGVIPEMIITKSRSAADYWSTYHSGLTSDTYQVQLNLTNGQLNTGQSWGPATETFKPQYAGNANYSANHSGRTYIAYLFATLPGVSKVGSYTGSNNVGEQVIDCGFTSGAKFVLVKSTGTGEWYIFDSSSGITVGSTDPVMQPQSSGQVYTEAGWAGADMIQPDPSGFKLTTNGQINNYTSSYIFYAVA